MSNVRKEPKRSEEREKEKLEGWKPKTSLGKKVKEGKITSLDEILDTGQKILEPQIVEMLLADMESELLLIGQSKGKFGGGQRRVFKQTQKKTCEGNRPKFTTIVVMGNKDGYVGIGYGKSRETVPAREKAIRNAKLNVFKIRRGSGSWQDDSSEPHSIPFMVEGKSGSVRLKLMPAPPGTGLCAHKEVQKILKLAGVQNIWSKTSGHRNTTTNLIMACERALKRLMIVKVEDPSIVEGTYKENIKKEFEAVSEAES
ncbi:30S ribosomal protein S5 [Candidatus Woesearchaeota archaeon]|nr:30S ribosomal protein S5 [Candidatus Woesearchaeota archaeon]